MRVLEILLVEDNPGDVRLMREAMAESRVPNHISVVVDGDAAVDFLEKRGGHAHAPTPDLVLLDLNLPKVPGKDVLRHIKGTDRLKRIPVVALSASDAPEDITACYAGHANGYITKPLVSGSFLDMMHSITGFWFDHVEFPPHRP